MSVKYPRNQLNYVKSSDKRETMNRPAKRTEVDDDAPSEERNEKERE